MALAARQLEKAGHTAKRWGLGYNLGATADRFDKAERRLVELNARTGDKIALVGWSLGGVMARETAKCRPDLVERVVTLGSPFSGDPRANRIWRLYELIAGHKVDAPPIDCTPEEKPPVPTIALWSRKDGVIAVACARGRPGECDRAIEIDSTHLGMASAPKALIGTLEALRGKTS